MDQQQPPVSNESPAPAATSPQPGAQTPPQTPVNGSPGAPVEPLAVNAPPGPGTSPGAAPATPQALTPAGDEDEEAWRRNRPRPEPSSRTLNVEAKPAPPAEPLLPATALRVEYTVKVSGGTDVVAQVNSRFDLPLGLLPECISATDASFGEIFNRILFEPLQIRVRGFLQSKYEQAHPTGPLQNGNGKNDPGGAAEFVQQESGQTCTGSDSWPESLDEVAKLAGFPDGLGTRKKRNGTPS